MRFSLLLICLFLVLTPSCDSSKFLESVEDILNAGDGPLSQAQIAEGLKEALAVGIRNGADEVSQLNGYLGNPQIRIPWPQEVQNVANTLESVGLGNLVDKVETSLNRAAEEAAQQAKPIFVNAIRQMTFNDALAILKGDRDAATDYLRNTTSQQLTQKFRPVISNSLNSVKATQFWDEATDKYNQIPLVKDVTLDLPDYVTARALDGLFLMVEKEEAKIRENPAARVTDLLKRVFALQD